MTWRSVPSIPRSGSVAVGSRARAGLDVVAVICALMDLVDSDCVDLLDLDRAGPVGLDDLAEVDAAGQPPLAENRMLRHGVERILTQRVELATAINEHVVGARLQRVATS